ncbi:alpha-L-arabinofuranosidase C-terminal domain-containing protein [Bifidobacterium olomucense]|uniref:non-reducing end alpha-L-arabinofuranosidase n=1 Tax=Bifidobacterium olomucense TaxID=2675324 RepID=A0A7Y0EYP3_9BIFI|nr:alpha-L-arabinofuranosidase C-terminal domain-containing protein [Bifidobacterium sp. DSM 109959]NMM98856.1 alpha-L-arabinofuranosidase [Bifidobacterium sp. DSM 109959]
MTDVKAQQPVTISVRNSQPGTPISPDLWGIFLEDINYAVDGGLNADLIQNGAFEYNRTDNPRWSHLFGWTIAQQDARHSTGYRDVSIRTDEPVAAENPHHLAVRLTGGRTTLVNRGFDGIPLTAGQQYECSAWVRTDGADVTAIAELIDDSPAAAANETSPLAHAEVTIADSRGWQHIRFTLDCAAATAQGALRLTVAMADSGNGNDCTDPGARTACTINATFRIDWVSLRPCGSDGSPRLFREDLVQALRDLHPRFMRFPGGCITHGVEVDNMYRWKRTIGPVEHRPHQYGYWGYYQSFTIGFHEYFLLCEAIGAKPLPVLPVGVSCQNTAGGVTTVPMDQMGAFVQDALDLIEYANGPITSPWGAKRAAAGHPEPFGLEYLGLGNEDAVNEAFRERFTMIHDAVKREYPNIAVIGTAGPVPNGENYEAGWSFARTKHLDMIDEHAYKSPQWWFSHLDHYDGRDPNGPATYIGEYGSWSNMQISALAEAAIMTSIERNGNTVRMASYAPLFGRLAHTQWNPDLIYFDNEQVMPTLNYWVQQMYTRTTMSHVLPTAVDNAPRFTPAPRDWTGLRFSSVDQGTFVFSGIRITAKNADGTEQTVTSPALTLTGAGTALDTGLKVPADEYRIDFTVRRTDGEDGLIIDFGALTGSDYFRWAFGDWGNKYYILKRVGDGLQDEAVPAYEGGVESNIDYHVTFEVSGQGSRVRVKLNGQPIHDYQDNSAQTRFVAHAGRNTNGELIVRIVNATDQPQYITLDGDEPLLTSATHGTATVLAADWDAGKPFEPAPVRPRTVTVTADDLSSWQVEPYSFTVFQLPQ